MRYLNAVLDSIPATTAGRPILRALCEGWDTTGLLLKPAADITKYLGGCSTLK
jgi:hypothetical protein